MSASFFKCYAVAIAVPLLALGGCGTSLMDDGSGFLKTKSGQMVAWPTGAQVQFESDDSVPSDLRDQIAFGQDELNSQIGRVQVNVRLQSSQAPKIKRSKDEVIGDGKNGIYFLPEPWPWADDPNKKDSDAMTVVINHGTTIVEADIFYRSSTYSAKYSTPGQHYNRTEPNNNADKGKTKTTQFALSADYSNPILDRDAKWTKVAFIHECMHALGFTHIRNEGDSIMNPVVSTSLYNNPFSEGDLLRLQKLY